MKLSTFTDYSLRVLIYLAVQPGQRATIAQIATAFDVSENHLVKVVHFLGKQGWLNNVRGKGGGMELGRLPTDIVVGQVVRSTEGSGQIAECYNEHGGDCAIAPQCRLRDALEQALAAFHGVLDGYTLADLVANRQELATVLFLPHPLARPRAGSTP
jgi:Rrf2 family transcriptional regulator, nitric oxide-sensitive transcriptional repressor